MSLISLWVATTPTTTWKRVRGGCRNVRVRIGVGIEALVAWFGLDFGSGVGVRCVVDG